MTFATRLRPREDAPAKHQRQFSPPQGGPRRTRTEFQSWQSVFDVSFVPIAVTAGLLLALLAAIFSRVAGVVVFTFVVAGAAAYGLRDEIVALAA